MTTPTLVERLRELAGEHKHPLVGWETRLVETLREAADALMDEEGRTLKWMVRHDEAEARAEKAEERLEKAREALNATLDYAGHLPNCPAGQYTVGVPVICICGWPKVSEANRAALAAIDGEGI